LQERVANPYFGIIPQSSTLGDPTIPLAQLLKPFPAYSSVSLYRNNVGTTRYQGFELSARRRLARGLSYTAAYTGSRLLDDASSVFDVSVLTGSVASYPVADTYDRRLERDYSTGDIPHVFTSSVVWDVPSNAARGGSVEKVFGTIVSHWTIATFITLQSGVPFAITQATNSNAFAGFGVLRPNLVGDPELPTKQRNAAHWFNTGAFQTPDPFTIGNASRNPVRGPSYRDVDITVARRIPVNASHPVELRAEIFNVLNTVNLGPPAAVNGAGNFGTITSALDPRVVQLVVKYAF
jgi:hypothetical protein